MEAPKARRAAIKRVCGKSRALHALNLPLDAEWLNRVPRELPSIHIGRNALKVRTYTHLSQTYSGMRRAQSVRHYARASLAPGADDLGVLKEDESVEDVLRRQLLEKGRECDKVCGGKTYSA